VQHQHEHNNGSTPQQVTQRKGSRRGTNSRPPRKRARQEDGSDHDVPKQRRSDNDGVEGDTDGNSDSDDGSGGDDDGDGDGTPGRDGTGRDGDEAEAEENPRRHFADITEATTEDDVRGLLLQLLRATLRHDDAAFPLDLESFQYNRAVDRIPLDVLGIVIVDDDGRLSEAHVGLSLRQPHAACTCSYMMSSQERYLRGLAKAMEFYDDDGGAAAARDEAMSVDAAGEAGGRCGAWWCTIADQDSRLGYSTATRPALTSTIPEAQAFLTGGAGLGPYYRNIAQNVQSSHFHKV
jgi:hypothetical protein